MRLGGREVLALARLLGPGHGDQPVEVVARDGGLGRHRRHGLEALELLERLLLGVLGHAGLLDLLAQLLDLVAAVVLAAQLLLDRLHLLVEVVLLLGALHLLLDAALDALVDLELVHLGLEDRRDARQPFLGREDLQQVLLVLDGQRRGGRRWCRRACRGPPRALPRAWRRSGRLLESLTYCSKRAMTLDISRLDPAAALGLARDQLHHDLAGSPGPLLELERAAAIEALHQDLHVAVGQLQALHDVADGAEGVDLLRTRVVAGGVVLGGEEDALALDQGVLEGLDGARPPDHERDHHVGKHHDVPQGHHAAASRSRRSFPCLARTCSWLRR